MIGFELQEDSHIANVCIQKEGMSKKERRKPKEHSYKTVLIYKRDHWEQPIELDLVIGRPIL